MELERGSSSRSGSLVVREGEDVINNPNDHTLSPNAVVQETKSDAGIASTGEEATAERNINSAKNSDVSELTPVSVSQLVSFSGNLGSDQDEKLKSARGSCRESSQRESNVGNNDSSSSIRRVEDVLSQENQSVIMRGEHSSSSRAGSGVVQEDVNLVTKPDNSDIVAESYGEEPIAVDNDSNSWKDFPEVPEATPVSKEELAKLFSRNLETNRDDIRQPGNRSSQESEPEQTSEHQESSHPFEGEGPSVSGSVSEKEDVDHVSNTDGYMVESFAKFEDVFPDAVPESYVEEYSMAGNDVGSAKKSSYIPEPVPESVSPAANLCSETPEGNLEETFASRNRAQEPSNSEYQESSSSSSSSSSSEEDLERVVSARRASVIVLENDDTDEWSSDILEPVAVNEHDSFDITALPLDREYGEESVMEPKQNDSKYEYWKNEVEADTVPRLTRTSSHASMQGAPAKHGEADVTAVVQQQIVEEASPITLTDGKSKDGNAFGGPEDEKS